MTRLALVLALLLVALAACGCAARSVVGGSAPANVAGALALNAGVRSARVAPADASDDTLAQVWNGYGMRCCCPCSLFTILGSDTLIRRAVYEEDAIDHADSLMGADRAAAEQMLRLREQAAAPDSSSNWVAFRMPRHYAEPGSYRPDLARPLPLRYYRWRVGISTQSRVWRDSVEIVGPQWGRDLSNMPKWLPGAQVYPLCEGWAWPGDSVRARLPLVSSLSWPFTAWGAACTDSCQREWVPLASFGSN